MMSVRFDLKAASFLKKEVNRMADIISGKSRFGGGSSSGNKKVIRLVSGPEKNDNDNLDEAEIKNRVSNRLRRIAIIIVVSAAVIIAGVFAVLYLLDGITYSDYSVVQSVNRDDSETANYVGYGDGYVRYSNDGIAYYSAKGTAVWNQTYTMQKPQVKICGDTLAVGDINGSKIYIFDKSGNLGVIDTSLAISQIEVANKGVVAAVLEDNDANYINLYDTDGTKIYTVKTSLAGDGYPLDISISPDATKLIASYLYVSGESMKTNVVFYNFSEVGQNEVERVVGGFNHYDSTIVGDVHFIDENTAVAVGENVVSIYSIKEYPKLSKEITIENEIDRVFFGDEYIGLVLKNSDSGDIYRLVVYNTSGNKVCETTFSTQYDSIVFDGKSIVMSSDTGLALLNLKGKKLADIAMSLPIQTVIPVGHRGEYICVNSKYIQNIRLK